MSWFITWSQWPTSVCTWSKTLRNRVTLHLPLDCILLPVHSSQLDFVPFRPLHNFMCCSCSLIQWAFKLQLETAGFVYLMPYKICQPNLQFINSIFIAFDALLCFFLRCHLKLAACATPPQWWVENSVYWIVSMLLHFTLMNLLTKCRCGVTSLLTAHHQAVHRWEVCWIQDFRMAGYPQPCKYFTRPGSRNCALVWLRQV